MSEKLTLEQGIEFMSRMKHLKKEDLETCANIIDLYVHSVITHTRVDYTKCIPRDDINNKKT